ncbi:MAG: hypothetical protein PHP32_00420 [Candidatus Izemoplasmatales bacterium]|nr:hypothetical protein [Candidatus Izemoplasmatales bacterium]
MTKVVFSPKKNYPFMKYVLVFLFLFALIYCIYSWVSYFLSSKDLLALILSTSLLISLTVLIINFWNYEISFMDNQMTISNWCGKKKIYLLEHLRKEAIQYLEKNLTLIVLFDELHSKNVLLRYSTKTLRDYLESLGFRFNSTP